jgi:hypothetical protein
MHSDFIVASGIVKYQAVCARFGIDQFCLFNILPFSRLHLLYLMGKAKSKIQVLSLKHRKRPACLNYSSRMATSPS